MKGRSILLGLALLPAAALGNPEVVPGGPDTFVAEPRAAELGCWAMFFAEPGYVAPVAQLTNRSFIDAFEPGGTPPADLKPVGGREFFRRAGSLIVGPHAEVVGYAEPNFSGGKTLTVGAGRRVADLEKIEFHERVKSLKVFCNLE